MNKENNGDLTLKKLNTFGALVKKGYEINISEVLDKTGTFVSEGDLISFCYGLPSYDVIQEVVVRKGIFFAVAKDNDPLSCILSELKILVGEFEIIGNVFDFPESKIV